MPGLVFDTTVTVRLHIYISALRTNKRNKNLIHISAFLVGRCHVSCLTLQSQSALILLLVCSSMSITSMWTVNAWCDHFDFHFDFFIVLVIVKINLIGMAYF